MQRSTVHPTRRAQALLPSDDDGSKIGKSPTLSSYARVLFRRANLAAFLFVAGIFIYLNSGFKLSVSKVTVMQSNNKGLISDQVMALQSENEILRSENEVLRQRLESVQQSNVRRHEDKPAAVVAAVTPSRRSIPVKVVGAPVMSTGVLAAIAAPVATTTNKVAVVSALKPIFCQEFIDEAKSGTYRGRQVIDPNLKKGRFTRQTTTEHPFWISIHNKEFDNVRWGIYENGYYYERALGKIWTDILREASPGSRVLDVGYVALRFTFLQLLCSVLYHLLLFCCVADHSRAEFFLQYIGFAISRSTSSSTPLLCV
jgi:hypothetical protein